MEVMKGKLCESFLCEMTFMTKSLEFYLPFSSMRYLASRAGHFYPLFSSNFENFHHNLQFSLSLTFSKSFFFSVQEIKFVSLVFNRFRPLSRLSWTHSAILVHFLPLVIDHNPGYKS